MQMEFKVTVDVTDRVYDLFNAFLSRTETVSAAPAAAAPVITLPKDKKKEAAKTPAAETTGTAGSGEIKLEDIRAKVVGLRDAGKKDATIRIMADYSITKLSDLPEDQYRKFLDDLNAVK